METLTKSHLIAAQNNAIRKNYVKAKVDKTQQKSKYMLRGDRDETINHIISQCIKLAQMVYKARHEWVEKEIYWELCKKLKFDHTIKYYMHKSQSVQKNKILGYFEIQTDYLILDRRLYLVINSKKKKKWKREPLVL